MLFKEFVLHNFGIYRGRHVVNLEPERGRPIILFGALNGSGKTTFLDGLQLVLYGKQARCAGRGSMAYPDFLRSCINRYIPPGEGAALELQFTHHHEGRWQTIRVYRAWSVRNETVRETLEVYRDGDPDTVLSEHWNEYVEDFIPSQISELFFFDGEKIEALAEESSASAIIRTGIHALLGLDVVDRLSADLKVIQRRRRAEGLDTKAQAQLTAKQAELDVLTQEMRNLVFAAAEQRDKVAQAEVKAKAAKEQYRLEGGELAEQAAVIDARLQKLREEKKRQDARLIELASGAAPLLLVQDLLNSAHDQAVREQETKRAKELLDELKARDRSVLKILKRAESRSSVIEKVAAKLAEDRTAREHHAVQPIYLHIDPPSLALYSKDNLKQLRAEIKRELARARELSEQIDHCERTLAGMPSTETLAPLAQACTELTDVHQRELGGLAYIEQKQAEVDRSLERVEREYQSLMAQEAQLLFKSETNERVLEHIAKVEGTLKQYRQVILAKNLARLSALILESFQCITRKKNMFARIEIAATDYRLSLYDSQGNQVPSYQLSAGERQLLAVSILWGLSRAAGRPLPAIIDTPLGRLDGEHRSKLVKNYFPAASHQVILLSTDQEIDDVLYSQLSNKISKEYIIEFNNRTLGSEIRQGYFDFCEAVQ